MVGKKYIQTLDSEFWDMKRGDAIVIDLNFHGPNNHPVIHQPSASIGKQPKD